jgi:hypothetical protein
LTASDQKEGKMEEQAPPVPGVEKPPPPQKEKLLQKKDRDRNRKPELNRAKTMQNYRGNAATRSNRSQGRGR